MPILFSAVAKQKTIVNKYETCEGNFVEILEQVISKLSGGNNKMTYLHGRYLLHFILDDGYLYFCVTDKLCQRSRAFLFLNEIKRRFSSNQTDFTHTLAEQMYRYNEDYNTQHARSTITIRSGEIDELNSIGVDSSESILGEKLLLVNNEEKLSYSTISYVEEKPEKVVISFKNNKLNIYIMASLIAVAIFLMFSLNPLSFAIVPVVFILFITRTIKHRHDSNK